MEETAEEIPAYQHYLNHWGDWVHSVDATTHALEEDAEAALVQPAAVPEEPAESAMIETDEPTPSEEIFVDDASALMQDGDAG